MVRLLLLYSLLGHSQYPKDIEAIMWHTVLHMLLTMGRPFVLAPAFAKRIARLALFFLRVLLPDYLSLWASAPSKRRPPYLLTLPFYFKHDTSNV